MFVLTLTSYSSMDVNAVNSTKWYTIFDAKEGYIVGGYSLESNPLEDNSRDYYIPDDGRYADGSVVGVVKIITSKGWASGFVIDEHTIGTAAHCVFDRINGSTQNSNVKIEKILIFDEHNNVIKTITNAYDVHVPNAFISSASCDYAMITVADPLSEYMCFNLGAMTDSIFDSNLAVYCTGFPQYMNSTTTNSKTMHGKYTDYGKIVSVTGETGDEVFFYEIDTSGGNSGGPVYTKSSYNGNDYYTVIGIHTLASSADGETYLRGGGVRMTTNLLHFYKNNPNIAWEE